MSVNICRRAQTPGSAAIPSARVVGEADLGTAKSDWKESQRQRGCLARLRAVGGHCDWLVAEEEDPGVQVFCDWSADGQGMVRG